MHLDGECIDVIYTLLCSTSTPNLQPTETAPAYNLWRNIGVGYKIGQDDKAKAPQGVMMREEQDRKKNLIY